MWAPLWRYMLREILLRMRVLLINYNKLINVHQIIADVTASLIQHVVVAAILRRQEAEVLLIRMRGGTVIVLSWCAVTLSIKRDRKYR